jgi:hypothetical protein
VVSAAAAQLKYDLAISATATAPSPVAAGLEMPAPAPLRDQNPEVMAFAMIALSLVALGGVLLLRTNNRTLNG